MKHKLSVALAMVLLFLGAQYLGILVLTKYVDSTSQPGAVVWKALPRIGTYQPERPQLKEQTSFIYIIAAVLVATMLVFLIIKFGRLSLWRAWFFLAVTLALLVSLGAFVPGWLAALLGLTLAALKVWRPSVLVHNTTELFIYPGLAAIFVPVINLSSMFILLAVISFYDMYAVWKSKHMIAMAKFQSQAGVFAGIVLPAKTGIKTKGQASAAVLGGGDIGFPLLFAGVLMKTTGVQSALIIPVFTGIALALLLFLGKKGRFYPAMPFLTLGCLAGYFVGL
ncbi:hypothetical protein HY642_05960 [Candidatus Woesearchaeota archaeon]|nr:hypothetical protein [Candidatus Woesearchaeota archaeon]